MSGGARKGPLAGRSRSLRLELVATLTIVLVMAVISLSLAAELIGQRRHSDLESQRLRDHARGVATLAAREYHGDSFDREALRQLLQHSASQLGAELEVHRVHDDGRTELLESVGIIEQIGPPPTTAPRIDDSLLASHNLLLIDEPIPTFGGQAHGLPVLRVIAEPSPWTRSHDWPQTLLVAAGVGVVLLVLGGLMLELLVLRPMRAVEQAASRVAHGDFDAAVPEEGPAEFRALAGSFNGMTAALRAQLEQIESQARQLERAQHMAEIGRLSAGVAHEVGNPLAAIVGYADLLLDPRDSAAIDESRREMLERIRDQTTRIQGIVGQLLDYSRPARTEIGPLALEPVTSELESLLAADPKATGVEIRVEHRDGSLAEADPGLLGQVLLNLTLNACKAAKATTEGEPAVRITVRRHPDPERDCIAIDVQDNGPGVEPEVRDHMFEPFFTTAGAGEGTGLGLAISVGLMEKMHGSLECLAAEGVTPIHDGGAPGAVFRVTLPRAVGPGSG